MSRVAIIIPTYKPKEYLEECFDSISKQTLDNSDFCAYIGLNGPRDDYEYFVKSCLSKFKFNYQYFYIPTAGVSVARNILIAESVEDYLVFLDDDDQISPNYLENLLSITTSKVMGIANVINFMNDRKNQFENYIGRSFSNLESNGTSFFLYRKYFSSPCAKMLHRDMIAQIKFDIKLARGEDGLFMANLSKNIHGFSKAPSDTIYYVNVRPASSSRKKVDRSEEFKKLLYLCGRYLNLTFCNGYNKLFMVTRIVATIKHLKKLL
ncbi:glycosyltransferase family A protein [Pseudoalteromonas mariniglutinosa]